MGSRLSITWPEILHLGSTVTDGSVVSAERSTLCDRYRRVLKVHGRVVLYSAANTCLCRTPSAEMDVRVRLGPKSIERDGDDYNETLTIIVKITRTQSIRPRAGDLRFFFGIESHDIKTRLTCTVKPRPAIEARSNKLARRYPYPRS